MDIPLTLLNYYIICVLSVISCFNLQSKGGVGPVSKLHPSPSHCREVKFKWVRPERKKDPTLLTDPTGLTMVEVLFTLFDPHPYSVLTGKGPNERRTQSNVGSFKTPVSISSPDLTQWSLFPVLLNTHRFSLRPSFPYFITYVSRGL